MWPSSEVKSVLGKEERYRVVVVGGIKRTSSLTELVATEEESR